VNVASSDESAVAAARVEALRRALALAPALTEAWINLGQTLYNSFRVRPPPFPHNPEGEESV
jgi:hypothetical protein